MGGLKYRVILTLRQIRIYCVLTLPKVRGTFRPKRMHRQCCTHTIAAIFLEMALSKGGIITTTVRPTRLFSGAAQYFSI